MKGFKPIKVTKIKNLGKENLPESDLTIQTNKELVQYEYIENDSKKLKIEPGVFNIINTSNGLDLAQFELKEPNLLDSIDNTKQIIQEKDKFFDKLHVFEQLKRDPKRSILLTSPPGVGKTSTINKISCKMLEDNNTTIIYWDTASISPSDVNNFFLNSVEFTDEVKRFMFVIEDINDGASTDGFGNAPRGCSSALLNLLDGVGRPFQGIPTFVIATTNNPERSVEALIDRPGRFDKVIELSTPKETECIELLKFVLEVEALTENQQKAAKKAADNEFSIAHIQETVARSKIDDISVLEATEQLIEHKKRFKNAFQDVGKKIGLSL